MNKSKKKLDTARRSRIKELQGTNVADMPSQQVIMARLSGAAVPANTLQSTGRGIPQLAKNSSAESATKFTLGNANTVSMSKESIMAQQVQEPPRQLGGSISIKPTARNSKLNSNIKNKEEFGVNSTGKLNLQNNQVDS